MIQDCIEERSAEENITELLTDYQEKIEQKLQKYKVKEKVIHNWIREIKNVQVMMMKSDVLQNNKAYIESILR